MRIRVLRAHNFRSIRDVELSLENLTVVVGPNNHGKSNILSAVEFVLQPSAKVSVEDFCAFREEDDNTLWVELAFDEPTAQEAVTFAKYVEADGSVTVRRQAVLGPDGPEITYHGYVSEPSDWWLQESAVERLSNRDDIQREAEAIPALSSLLDTPGRITKARILEFQAQYIASHSDTLSFARRLESSPFLGTKNVAAGVLPEFFPIPAVRDVAEEVKTKGTSAFGRLLQRAIGEMTERDPRVQDLRSRIASLVEELNDRRVPEGAGPSTLAALEEAIRREIGSWDVGVGIRVVPPELEKLFELGTELRINDGHETTPDRKGHGLQRAILFALVRAWAQVLRESQTSEGTRPRKASDSVVFAFEEPELFLHPHAQRVLFSSLKDIAAADGHQVLLCTHSTHFVSLDDYRSIVIASKDDPCAGTRIRQCTTDLFAGEGAADRKSRFHMAMWINPDRGEMFFARKVVFVEGETEKACLPYVAERLQCLDPSVSLIDCGSKHNLPLYIAIANAFSLRYTVVHDEDPLPTTIPQSWNENKVKEKRRTFELNATLQKMVDASIGSVVVCSSDFEGMCGSSHTQGEKKGKAIAALDFLATLTDDELPAGLVEAVREAYALSPIPRVFSNEGAPDPIHAA